VKDRITGKTVQESVPQGKQPPRKPRLSWEKEDIKKVRIGMDWKELTMIKEIWRQII
jgi:hypothetical protein